MEKVIDDEDLQEACLCLPVSPKRSRRTFLRRYRKSLDSLSNEWVKRKEGFSVHQNATACKRNVMMQNREKISCWKIKFDEQDDQQILDKRFSWYSRKLFKGKDCAEGNLKDLPVTIDEESDSEEKCVAPLIEACVSSQLLHNEEIVHFEGTISEYESEEEDLNKDIIEPSQDLASATILEATQSPQSNTEIIIRKKGSEWLKTVNWSATPVKSATPSPPDDSTKKKPRFVKGALAEKLRKLEKRESAEFSFWKHSYSHASSNATDNSKVILVKIRDIHIGYSLCHALCDIVTSHHAKRIEAFEGTDESQHDSADSPVFKNTSSADHIQINTDTTDETQKLVNTALDTCMLDKSSSPVFNGSMASLPVCIKTDLKVKPSACKELFKEIKFGSAAFQEKSFEDTSYCKTDDTSECHVPSSSSCTSVLFSQRRAVQLRLHVGDLVKIHPPWRRLKMADFGVSIIFCTDNSEIVTTCETDLTSSFICKVDAVWQCPCLNDASLEADDCPAALEAASYSFSQSQNIAKSQSQSLEMAYKSQSFSPDNVLSVMEMPEGKCISDVFSVSIVARVQRIFCTEQSSQHCRILSIQANSTEECAAVTTRWSLLLQDSTGSVYMLKLNTSVVDDKCWKRLLQNGEGSTFGFTHLRILERVTCSKKPELFSVLWAGAAQQDDTRQEFCYVLGTIPGQSKCILSDQNVSEYNLVILEELAAIEKGLCCDTRHSFLVKVIHHAVDTLFCTDCSLSTKTGYLKVTLKPDCSIANDVSLVFNNRRLSCSPLLVLKDIGAINGHLYGDGFSRLLLPSSSSLPDINDELVKKTLSVKPVLPDFTGKSSCDLVSAKGVIVDVDENNAFSWPVCNMCESSNLQTDLSGSIADFWNNTCNLLFFEALVSSFLYCPSCQLGVSQPIIKMTMNVFLKINSSQHTQPVLVQLHQNTIEKLLPADLIEQGYDMEMILGIEVGPINCYCDPSLPSSSKQEQGNAPSVVLTEITID